MGTSFWTGGGAPVGGEGLEEAQTSGLQTFALVAGSLSVLMILFLALSNAIGTPRWDAFATAAVQSLVQIGFSLVVWFGATRLPQAQRLALGVALYVILIGVSTSYEVIQLDVVNPVIRPGWACLTVLAFAILVPAAKRFHSALGGVAVLALPAAVAFYWMQGHWQSELVDVVDATFRATMPTAVCAIVGVLIAWRQKHLLDSVDALKRDLLELGSYRLIEQIGQGGMGEVWKAEHVALKRVAAVKIIRQSRIESKDPARRQVAIARFEKEARLTSNLTSAHTVELFDFGRTTDSLYYAMELLEGMDLETMVEAYGRLSQERVHHFLVQLCDSLGEAHNAGLIHRDLKPANIFICPQGIKSDFVKLLDFGLAIETAEYDSDVRLTTKGKITGTPATMSPEQAYGRNLDARSDIYSLGCCAYYMLTGRMVFAAPTRREVLIKHVKVDPRPPSDFVEIEPYFESLVLQCLAKEPAGRHKSIPVLLEKLELCEFDREWSEKRARTWYTRHLAD